MSINYELLVIAATSIAAILLILMLIQLFVRCFPFKRFVSVTADRTTTTTLALERHQDSPHEISLTIDHPVMCLGKVLISSIESGEMMAVKLSLRSSLGNMRAPVVLPQAQTREDTQKHLDADQTCWPHTVLDMSSGQIQLYGVQSRYWQ
nr:uncharacterized protein LOC128698438 [Cherax quadricarinatus]